MTEQQYQKLREISRQLDETTAALRQTRNRVLFTAKASDPPSIHVELAAAGTKLLQLSKKAEKEL